MSVVAMGYRTPKDSTGTGKLGRQMKATKRHADILAKLDSNNFDKRNVDEML